MGISVVQGRVVLSKEMAVRSIHSESRLMTDTLKTWKVSLSSFKSLPKDDQIFIVQILQFMNEINILETGIHASWNGKNELPRLQRLAQKAQILFYVKTLAGKLYEGWLLTTKTYNKGMARRYDSLIPEASRRAMKQLKKYFGRNNIVKGIRQKYAFHYDSKRIEEVIGCHYPNGELTFVLPGKTGYGFCDLSADMTDASMLANIDSDGDKALDLMLKDILDVSTWFCIFVAGLVSHILRSLECQDGTEDTKGLLLLGEICLPYFAVRQMDSQQVLPT